MNGRAGLLVNVDTVIANAKQFLNAYYVLHANAQHIQNEINKINPFSISPQIFERLNSGELRLQAYRKSSPSPFHVSCS